MLKTQFEIEDFNPHNEDHQAALIYMHVHGRQHPDLRFKANGNMSVYHSMIDAYIRASVPLRIQERVVNEVEALKSQRQRVGRVQA